MTRIWMSGFEAGSLDVFPYLAGPTISAVQARTGNYSLFVSAIGHRALTSFGGNGYIEVFLRLGLYMTGGYGAYDRTFLTLLDETGEELLTFQVRQVDSVLLVRLGDRNDALIASGGIVPTNAWCCIEIRALIDNVSGIVQVRIDGVQVINFSGDTQYGAYDDAWMAMWGCGPGIGTSVYYVCYGYYDDLAINNVYGIRNNSWLGLGGIIGLLPIGVGNYTQLTPSAGANWQAVNEVPPDDNATYVEQATVNQRDTYEMEDLVITPGKVADVAAVQWLCRAYNTETQGGDFPRLLRLNGVDYQGDDVGYDRSYDYHPEILETSPATMQNWTGDEVNALEAGVVVK